MDPNVLLFQEDFENNLPSNRCFYRKWLKNILAVVVVFVMYLNMGEGALFCENACVDSLCSYATLSFTTWSKKKKFLIWLWSNIPFPFGSHNSLAYLCWIDTPILIVQTVKHIFCFQTPRPHVLWCNREIKHLRVHCRNAFSSSKDCLLICINSDWEKLRC